MNKKITDKYIERIKIDYPEDDKLMMDLQDFFKEAQAKQLILSGVSQQRELLSDLIDFSNNNAPPNTERT